MRPPAPGRLSTTICCFQIWVRRSATTRVATSGLLPAAAGVMNVTGLVGYSCACAGRLATMAMAAIHTAPNLKCRIRIGRSSRTDFTPTRPAADPGRRDQQVPSIRESSERAFRKRTLPQCELRPIVNGGTSPSSRQGSDAPPRSIQCEQGRTGNGGLKLDPEGWLLLQRMQQT